METLSTSVSTLQIHNLPSTTTPREQFNLYKPPQPAPHHLPHLHNKPNQISNRASSPFKNRALFSNSNPHFHSTTPTPKHVSPILHTKPTTGYAAALLDVARCNNNLATVEKDVRRLSKVLRHKDIKPILIDPFTKGQVMKEILEKGKFQRELVVVMKILIEKNKIGLMNEVLDEFERIYDQLNGTQVVMVSSRKKIEENQLIGIAKKVQKMSGAVKVKVRNLIQETSQSPSFAV
ncbi:hypothetical protein ACHQM5_000080 [Ranunculus cassubicifolius]